MLLLVLGFFHTFSRPCSVMAKMAMPQYIMVFSKDTTRA